MCSLIRRRRSGDGSADDPEQLVDQQHSGCQSERDGTAVPSPQLTVSAASLTFGDVTVNTASTQPVTLTSTGTAPVTINSATLSGTGFTVSGATFPVTLNPTQSVTLNVQFDPTAAGAATGQLTIQSNSSTNSTAVVNLSGTGTAVSSPQLTVSAASLTFGDVTVNTASTQPVTLTLHGDGASDHQLGSTEWCWIYGVGSHLPGDLESEPVGDAECAV